MPYEENVENEQTMSDTPSNTDGAAQSGKSGAHAKHAKNLETEFPSLVKQSRKKRRKLIAIIIVLVLILAGAGALIYMMISASTDEAVEQTQQLLEQKDTQTQETPETDQSTKTEMTTYVPNLVGLLGLTQDGALEFLQHGATVTSTSEVSEEGSAIKQELRVTFTDETSTSRSSSPTVYLFLDEAGAVVLAGYSVDTSSLGLGSVSFSDAVENEHIVESALSEAGLDVEVGSILLPDDSAEYSTYATDGTTLAKESYSFEGAATANGAQYTWSATLTYDYTMANTSDDLSDVVRTIYIYVEK